MSSYWQLLRWVGSCAALALLIGGCSTPIAETPVRPPAAAASSSPIAASPGSPTPAIAQVLTPSPLPADLGCLTFEGKPGQLWLLRSASVPRLLPHEGAQLTPEGISIISSTSYSPPPDVLWLGNVDGSKESKLYTAPDRIYGSDLSPDGKVLVLTTGASSNKSPNGDLWRIDIPSGTLIKLADDNAGYPSFSPDGRWIAVVRERWSPDISVGIISPDGKDHRVLFDGLLTARLQWGRDSSGFALALSRIGSSDGGEEFWWVPNSGAPAQLGRVAHLLPDLDWQPGAERFIYENGGDGSLHLANRDGGGDLIVPGSEGMVLHGVYGTRMSSWSPDGHWYAASKAAAKPQGRYGLDTFLVDTGNPSAPRPVDMPLVYGWLGAEHFLAGRPGDSYVDLFRCAPLGDCESLARIPVTAAGGFGAPYGMLWSYVRDCK